MHLENPFEQKEAVTYTYISYWKKVHGFCLILHEAAVAKKHSFHINRTVWKLIVKQFTRLTTEPK
jgi:hypothetical protein